MSSRNGEAGQAQGLRGAKSNIGSVADISNAEVLTDLQYYILQAWRDVPRNYHSTSYIIECVQECFPVEEVDDNEVIECLNQLALSQVLNRVRFHNGEFFYCLKISVETFVATLNRQDDIRRGCADQIP